MAKIRKSLIGAFLCSVMLLIGVCALTACGSKDYAVTFSIEGKEQTVEVVDGKVTFPADPAKEYYEFRGWYTTDTFDEGTEFTSDTKISGNVKVYAYFAPIYVSISVNGSPAEEIKLENLSTKTTEYTADAERKNLTFDGWYIDANCGTNYTTQDIDNLYARYVAEVVFDNGYETVYTAKVQVNMPVSKPDTEEIVKYYMDKEDIFFVDDHGNDVDFSKPITENTMVTVLWKTPNLEFSVNNSTGNLYFTGFKSGTVIGTNATMGNYPILSFPGKVTYNGKLMTVESFVLNNALENVAYACRKIIVNEGIKQISGLSCGTSGLITEIQLPSTLKIIENSFNNLSELVQDTLVVPEGTELILNSFWKQKASSTAASTTAFYDFDIVVPDSVINLAQVPTNLTFSQNSVFAKIDGAIYQKENGNDKEILIAKYDVTDNMLTVDEGVKFIQAGAFTSSVLTDVAYIGLPSTWQGIRYNANAVEYEYYISGRNGNLLYSDEQSIANAGKMIIDNLQDLERVLIYTSTYPEGASAEFISGRVDNNIKPYTDSAFADDNKVVFVGEITEGQAVTVSVRATHRVSGEYVIKMVSAIKSGQTELTREKVLSAVGLYGNNRYIILSETQFGEDYTAKYGKTVTCNQYIDVLYEDADGGYTYETRTDSVAITGFNEQTAIDDGSNLLKVVIPAEIEGLPVTEINEGAFKDNASISVVVIPSSVKTIGAEAFMNTTNLNTVDITAGGLEVIGRSAFENSNFETIKLPLAKLKNVEPYAFKSAKLKSFGFADGEKNGADVFSEMYIYYGSMMHVEVPVGSYVLKDSSDGSFYALMKYMGNTSVEMIKNTATEETTTVTVCDVQFVAVAGGTSNWALTLGASQRAKADYGDQYAMYASIPVVRYEIMEGSVYYLDNLGTSYGIEFGIISEVHKNAFTDIDEKVTAIKELSNGTKQCASTLYAYSGDIIYDTWLHTEDFFNTEIFEDGWWEGITKDNPDYDTVMEWIDYLRIPADHGLGY